MSRIESATAYTITHPDNSDTYRAEVLKLADGTNVGYRVKTDEAGRTEYLPLENGTTAELASEAHDVE
jgi:secreted trypsin-like serine protease